MINNPWLAMIITLILCVLWMRLINILAVKGIISSSVSRKIIHIGTGPLFVICWFLFPDRPISKYLAAFVPLLIVIQVLLVGMGKMKDHASVKSMARTGARDELLKGPLFYGIIFVLLTVFYWKTFYAVIPLMMLCGGDGVADLVGSRISSRILPWAKKKTVLGSLSMLVGGFLFSWLLILIFKQNFNQVFLLKSFTLSILLISMVSTLVESVTPSDYDNLTVPGAALVMSLILL